MNWLDAMHAVRYTDNRRTALLMALMWQAAADWGDEALLSNLQMNLLDPFGVANALTWACVPAPEDLRARLDVHSPIPPSAFSRFIPLG